MGSLSIRRRAFFSSDLSGAAVLGLCALATVCGWGHGRLTRQNAGQERPPDGQSWEDEDGDRWDGSGDRASAKEDPSVNSIGIRLVRIPPGEFTMGSPMHEELRYAEESQHRVRITRPFYLGQHEVTVGQYRRFVEETGHRTEAEKHPEENTVVEVPSAIAPGQIRNWRNPGFPQEDDHPVVYVSWPDAVAFCRWLSAKEGYEYRLPTEAEWEYACRAGMATRFSCGNAETDLFRAANVLNWVRNERGAIEHRKGSYRFTAPVGVFEPNGFGLHDMHGNVWEWCSDWYDRDYYLRSPTNDPKGPATGNWRLVRGGSFRSSPWHVRSANRSTNVASRCIPDVGFRVAVTWP